MAGTAQHVDDWGLVVASQDNKGQGASVWPGAVVMAIVLAAFAMLSWKVTTSIDSSAHALQAQGDKAVSQAAVAPAPQKDATQAAQKLAAAPQAAAPQPTAKPTQPAPQQQVAAGPQAAAPAAKPANEAGDPAALAKIKDYDAARWHPIHFKPLIDTATNEQCLACHGEVLSTKVRSASIAGVKASEVEAWYQTLDTYAGAQETFHARHLTTPMAKQVMNLSCTFCHQGNDPREEAAGSSATTTQSNLGTFNLRKMVNTSNTCLLCHGKFPAESMGLEGKWSDLREGMESADAPNGCLTCHADQFRTVRHQVTYLKPEAIEEAAKKGSSDLCFGCHGGRQWYRTSFPYPRHAWPGMDTSSVPDWAKNRPTESDAKYRLTTTKK